jgi:CRISPR-associated protein Cmr6
LLLDKFVESYDPSGQKTKKWQEAVQKPTAEDVVQRSQQPPPTLDFASLVQRWQNTLNAVNAVSFRCTTVSPLALHLARSSALENAGLCLHPLYGFAYLPGSGLKGMARAYAETIWLPTQLGDDWTKASDAHWKSALDELDNVFGFVPFIEPKKEDRDKMSEFARELTKRRKQRHRKRAESNSGAASAGSIIFYDAWPESWPRLIVDIVNNHHPEYYQDGEPPGDWENPVPVYFLAVVPGTTFTFALAKRRADVPNEPLQRAREWLLGALCHLGAGAKTAAGYGGFRPAAGDPPPLPLTARAVFETTLELVTPAFLAGAGQQAADCDLRPATLRGLLRWWWRTMHAGYVDVPTLRALEAAVWGDTNQGGAVRIVIEAGSKFGPYLYNHKHKDRFEPKAEFKRRHQLADRPNNKTTQGLFYVSYGMAEFSQGRPKQRYYLDAGSTWRVQLTARSTLFFRDRADAADLHRRGKGIVLTGEQLLEQAKAALWLLCTFGGVGSKSRKGFGSLQDSQGKLTEFSLETCREIGAGFRRILGLAGEFDLARAESAALGHPDLPKPVAVETVWADPWQMMDHVGFAYQAFAQRYKHDLAKVALGLPRKIHGPREDGPIKTKDGRPVQDSATWKPPVWLDCPKREHKTPKKDARHASPVHIHVARVGERLVVRALAFPAPYLPDLATSVQMLRGFLTSFQAELTQRGESLSAAPRPGRPPRQRSGRLPERAAPAAAPAVPGLPKAGDRVEAVLLKEKTRKGGWRARHVASGLAGPIQNTSAVPAEKQPGDTVTLIVRSVNPKEIAFAWPEGANS